MTVKYKLIEDLKVRHPGLAGENLSELISDQLFSEFEVSVPKEALAQAQSFAKALNILRESPHYIQSRAAEIEARGLKDPKNKSILMSYDFHWSAEKGLQLIEVNTNASFLALGEQMYRSRGLPCPIADFKFEEIRSNIEEELKLQRKPSPSKVAIIDEEPTQQRLYIEFLIYQNWFQSWGWESTICDFRKVPEGTEFIYNRHTDFYLEGPEAKSLKEKFISQVVCFSPNPFEYLLLADKQRMIDWHTPGFLSQMGLTVSQQKDLLDRVPEAIDLHPDNAAAIWSNRKKYFFKPKRSFGAKQTYRGGSISRKAFDEITPEDFIAQEFIPAPEVEYRTPEGAQNFKYDLRFYAYRDRIQMAVARIYQGQVTNLRTPYGGFAPIVWT